MFENNINYKWLKHSVSLFYKNFISVASKSKKQYRNVRKIYFPVRNLPIFELFSLSMICKPHYFTTITTTLI